MDSRFDFIVVGGGTAGCRLAKRLSDTFTRPSVLLIEVGGDAADPSLRIPYDRYSAAFTRPDYDHGYVTVPQRSLDRAEVPYARGKGLGGSSLLNFFAYCYGAKADFDRWAEMVGDDAWGWDQTLKRLRRIEKYNPKVPEGFHHYANPSKDDHGQAGAVDVGFPSNVEPEAVRALDAAVAFGYPISHDINTGNPIGMTLLVSTLDNRYRVTSASAHLTNKPANLTIWTSTRAVRVLLNGKRTVGVELEGGKKVYANKETLLTAGALDTPKLLLLSGIGTSQELASHNVECLHELPGVGKQLQDHCGVIVAASFKASFSIRAAFDSDPEKLCLARSQWLKDQTGPMTHHNCSSAVGFFKLPDLSETSEFIGLEPNAKSYLSDVSVPHYEIITNGPPPRGVAVAQDESVMTLNVILMNPQSRGSVTLRSNNPTEGPRIDFDYLSHPLDRRTMIDAVREALEYMKTPTWANDFKSFVWHPDSSADADILAYIKSRFTPIWHANGSVMMGKPDSPLSCVDSRLRVYGLQNLRVADLSVLPLTPNNHPQSTAYLVAEFAAEALIREHCLEMGSSAEARL
ncbi:MAG: hypothetical protein M1833_001376 [Piccolia ochrophora]|nr:MAG: hypothetical protein M1833_001376 [Piccolia ochrophora]